LFLVWRFIAARATRSDLAPHRVSFQKAPFRYLVGVALRKPGAHSWEPGGRSSAPTRIFPYTVHTASAVYHASPLHCATFIFMVFDILLIWCFPPFGRYPQGILPEGECEMGEHTISIYLCTACRMSCCTVASLLTHRMPVAFWLKARCSGKHLSATFVFAW
jgi:hypothetical protein